MLADFQAALDQFVLLEEVFDELPEGLAGTEAAVKFLAEEISPDTYTNIMDQYYPCYRAQEYPPLDRRLKSAEYKEALKAAREAGLTRLD